MAKEKRSVGRPPLDKAGILEKLELYIATEKLPILAEFCYLNNLWRQYLYENIEFSDAIEKLHCKKESRLERGALEGEYTNAMAMFSLKQLGWKDSTTIDIKNFEPLILQNEDGKPMMTLGFGSKTK